MKKKPCCMFRTILLCILDYIYVIFSVAVPVLLANMTTPMVRGIMSAMTSPGQQGKKQSIIGISTRRSYNSTYRIDARIRRGGGGQGVP